MFGKDRVLNILKYVAAGLSVLGLLAALYWVQTNDARKQAAALALQELARPYEQELSQLEAQLEATSRDYVYHSSSAELLIGFILSDGSDIPCIQSLKDQYGFSPVIILDCTKPLETVQALIAAVPPEWELMLYTAQLDSTAQESIADIKTHLNTLGRKDTGILFLRSRAVSDGDLAALRLGGFTGCTLYHDTPAVGQNPDGSVFFEYASFNASNFDSDGAEAFSQRLEDVYNHKASMLCVFDMEDLQPLETAAEKTRLLLQTIGQYAARSSCSYSTVSAVAEKLSRINGEKAAYELNAKKEAAAIEERIQALKVTIHDIYKGK